MRELGGHIVDGPTADGAFIIELSRADPKLISARIRSLKGRPDLIQSIEEAHPVNRIALWCALIAGAVVAITAQASDVMAPQSALTTGTKRALLIGINSYVAVATTHGVGE
ncbi:MAG: hypothetical protein WDM77_10605 [Steroidobacteraceae bacterium]